MTFIHVYFSSFIKSCSYMFTSDVNFDQFGFFIFNVWISKEFLQKSQICLTDTFSYIETEKEIGAGHYFHSQRKFNNVSINDNKTHKNKSDYLSSIAIKIHFFYKKDILFLKLRKYFSRRQCNSKATQELNHVYMNLNAALYCFIL